MTRDLILCAVVFLAVCYFLCFLFFDGLGRRNRRREERLSDFVDWEAEVARSARETAMRQHPAGGRQ